LLAAGIATACGSLPALGGPAAAPNENPTAPSGEEQKSDDAKGVEFDFTRPINSLEPRWQYRPSSTPGTTTEKEYAILRATTRIELDPWWTISLYGQTEGLNKQTSKRTGSTDDSGPGDSVIQAVLIRKLDERWAVGAGTRFVFPTASDELGSGKMQVMPGFGVRYSIPEWGDDTYFVPAMRYAVSVAGPHSRRDISESQLAPTFNLDLPGPWFVTLYPSFDIRINGARPVSGQTGPLFLPADAAIGYRLNDHLTFSLEGSVPIVKDYPVYDYKVELRVVLKN
jgi:hypothetical protein